MAQALHGTGIYLHTLGWFQAKGAAYIPYMECLALMVEKPKTIKNISNNDRLATGEAHGKQAGLRIRVVQHIFGKLGDVNGGHHREHSHILDSTG